MESIRVGRISSINYEAGKVRIVYKDKDSEVTPEIPLLCDEYYMPQIDDLVMVLHLPNGATAGCVLGRMWSDKNRPPESGEGLYRKDYSRTPGKAMLRFDDKAGELQLHCEQKIVISGAGEIELSGGTVTITGRTGDVVVDGVSLAHHTHEVDGDKTGEPVR